MGVAVRAYYETPRHEDDWLESWLELWDGEPGREPAARLRLDLRGRRRHRERRPRHPEHLQGLPERRLQGRAAAAGSRQTPEEWGFRDENLVGRIGSAALPMGFNRKPHYTRGVLLVGDAGGMVNPFNGEGIDYAIESGHWPPRPSSRRSPARAGPARERVAARRTPRRSTRATAATSRSAGCS